MLTSNALMLINTVTAVFTVTTVCTVTALYHSPVSTVTTVMHCHVRRYSMIQDLELCQLGSTPAVLS